MNRIFFTENELPKGMMMLVGKTFDGKELACVIYAGKDADYYKSCVELLAEKLNEPTR